MITTGQNLCVAISGGCLGAIATTGQASWWSLAGSVLSLLAQLVLTAWARRGPRRPW